MTPEERDPEREPPDRSVGPAEGASGPADGSVGPAEVASGPADGSVGPAEGSVGPAEGTSGPAGGSVDPDEVAVADRLVAARPFPAPSFRGELGRHLRAEDPGHRSRPRFLWPVALLWLLGGLLVMVYGLLQSLGKL